jgi:hypothetical protein
MRSSPVRRVLSGAVPALTLWAAASLLPAARAQAVSAPPPAGATAPPSLEEVRRAMGIPSTDALRGQQDAIGFASTAAQMQAVWDLAAAPPAPRGFGPPGAPGVAGLIAPHDDYLYAGRVYYPLFRNLRTREAVIFGVTHGTVRKEIGN